MIRMDGQTKKFHDMASIHLIPIGYRYL